MRNLLSSYEAEMMRVRPFAPRDLRKRFILFVVFMMILSIIDKAEDVFHLVALITFFEATNYFANRIEWKNVSAYSGFRTALFIALHGATVFSYMLVGVLLAGSADLGVIALSLIWIFGVFLHVLNSFGSLPAFTTAMLIPMCICSVIFVQAISQVDPEKASPLGILAFSLGMAKIVGYLIDNMLEKTKLRQRLIETSKALIERDEELDVSRSQLLDAVECMPDGFAYFDKNSGLVVANRRFRDLYSRSGEGIVLGSTYQEIVRIGMQNQQFLGVSADDESWLSEHVSSVEKPGGFIHVLFDGAIIQSFQRATTDGGRVGIHIDVTALARAREVAEAASKSKTHLLASVSHEIRTPLTAVLGMADVLQTTPLNSAQRDIVETIRRSGWDLLRLLNDLIDISRVEAGNLRIEEHDFDLNELVRKIEVLHGSVASQKGVQFLVKRDKVKSFLRKGDSLRISQILNNVIGNALKFTSSGAVILEIEDMDEKNTRFTVTDSGIGMSEAELGRLFVAFEQGDGLTARRYGGSGLGMSIVKSIVELLDGKIEVESKPRAGTRVSVDLCLPPSVLTPSCGVHFHDIEVPLCDLSGGDASSELARILVVDDLGTNRQVFTMLLEQFGLSVDVAPGGVEACDLLLKHRYDAVFLDISMSGMNGVEVLATVKDHAAENDKPLPYFIAATANLVEDEVAQFLQSGFNEVLSKPVNRALLREVLVRAKCLDVPRELDGSSMQ